MQSRIRHSAGLNKTLGSTNTSINWASWWATRYLTGLVVTTTSDTTQTITATIVGTGADGISWEYRAGGVGAWSVAGTSVLGSYPAIGLTAGTLYEWRARLYKGTHFGNYCTSASGATADSYALAFLTATGIVDNTSISAISNLVYDLLQINATQANFVNFATPASSICKAIYPLVGSTPATQKYNLIDPRDLDAAFRIVWANDHDANHTSMGYKPNGTDQYGDTKLYPSGTLSLGDCHLSLYPTDNSIGEIDMGCKLLSTRSLFLATNYGNDVAYFTCNNENAYNAISISNCSSIGFHILSRTSVTYFFAQKEGKLLKTNIIDNSGASLPNRPIYIGAINNSGGVQYASKNYGFASAGLGIIPAAAILYDEAVYKYMLALGRVSVRLTTTVRAGIAVTTDDKANVTIMSPYSFLIGAYGFKFTGMLELSSYTPPYKADIDLIITNYGNNFELATHADIVAYRATHTPAETWLNIIKPIHDAIVSNFATIPTTFGNHMADEDDPGMVSYLFTNEGYGIWRHGEGLGIYGYYYDGSSQVIEAYSLNNLNSTFAGVCALIDDALANDKILVLYTHAFGATVNDVTVTYALFERIMAYVKFKNMTFYKMNELVSALFP